MEAKATAKYIRISPHKARLVADVIRGFEYPEAEDALRTLTKKAAVLIIKILKSARANMMQIDEEVKDDELFVKKIYVDEGPIMYRFRPRAKGRASRIRKRLSHITVVLATE